MQVPRGDPSRRILAEMLSRWCPKLVLAGILAVAGCGGSSVDLDASVIDGGTAVDTAIPPIDAETELPDGRVIYVCIYRADLAGGAP